MPIFLSILRGINVSGQKKILMADLKVLYEELNLKNITTYIQSGNVVFESKVANDLNKKIERKLFEKYTYNVSVIIKTADEMQFVVANNPFLKEKHIELDKLHVSFLSDHPAKEWLDKVKTLNYLPDQFVIIGKEIYLYCPNGYGRTKLTNNFFENKLKVKATTRNWKTVNELYVLLNK